MRNVGKWILWLCWSVMKKALFHLFAHPDFVKKMMPRIQVPYAQLEQTHVSLIYYSSVFQLNNAIGAFGKIFVMGHHQQR